MVDIAQQASVAITESWNGTSWTEVNDLNMKDILQEQEHGSTASAIIVLGTTQELQQHNRRMEQVFL